MSAVHYKFLFYVTLSYSFSILRPVEEELKRRGHKVAWFIRKGSEAEKFVQPSDHVLPTVAAVKEFNSDALLAPGNSIPVFFPGIKVQVFHGFDSGKKGKFTIRDYFDLYCTQGPMTTEGFLAKRSGAGKATFDVVETGWPKLDALFKSQTETSQLKTDVKQVLYAPTFSPKLTSTYSLLNEISRLSKEKNWQWRVKFHSKVTAQEVAMYRAIENENLKVVETDSVISLLQSADVLLSDTSSILSEFCLLDKAVVCYKNRRPASWMINFSEVGELEKKLLEAFDPDAEKLDLIAAHRLIVHPYQDGLSSQRVVDAVEDMIAKGISHLNRKPKNVFRNFKMRLKLGHYKL